MKRYKSLLSLKWVAALLLVVGFVSCADEEIISNSKNLYKSFKTAKRLIRHIQVVKHYLDKIITAKAERAANKAAKKAAAKN